MREGKDRRRHEGRKGQKEARGKGRTEGGMREGKDRRKREGMKTRKGRTDMSKRYRHNHLKLIESPWMVHGEQTFCSHAETHLQPALLPL